MRANEKFSKIILQVVLVPISAIFLRVRQDEVGRSADGPGTFGRLNDWTTNRSDSSQNYILWKTAPSGDL